MFAATILGAPKIAGGKVGCLDQPAGDHHPPVDRMGFAGEGDEDSLRDVLGEIGVADLPPGGGIDLVDVPRDQLRERIV